MSQVAKFLRRVLLQEQPLSSEPYVQPDCSELVAHPRVTRFFSAEEWRAHRDAKTKRMLSLNPNWVPAPPDPRIEALLREWEPGGEFLLVNDMCGLAGSEYLAYLPPGFRVQLAIS